MKVGKQTKKEAKHSAAAMKAGKAAMIIALGKGVGPGEAAEALGLGRSTVYEWKREDAEFSAKWEEPLGPAASFGALGALSVPF